MLNRRAFLKSSAAAIPATAAFGALDPVNTLAAEIAAAKTVPNPAGLAPLPARLGPATVAVPWQQKIRRVAQTNMTEHDPVVMNVDQWADYWHNAGAEIIFISVTGILAFYPSKVPFHRHGKFLNGRDFFGECVAAARKRNMRVVARMSPDLNWGDALEAHPEWAMRNRDGSVQHSGEDPRLFKTCMYSTYMDDYVPAVIREVNSLYDVDCFYTNGWPPIGSLPDCHCNICSKLPPTGTPAYWQAFNNRVFDLWQRYDSLAKEKKPDSFFFANLGGSVHAGPNLDRLGRIAAWYQADNQGRTYEDAAVWGCSQQGRVCTAIMNGKFAANVTGAYSTSSPGWRNASKNPAEATMWLNETIASGMIPYYHFVGAENGLGEDRRWQKTGADWFHWAAKHEAHLTARRSIANIGVVMGQSTQLLYPGPGLKPARRYMHETIQGLYDALLRGRFAFDYVHEDRLNPERLRKYRALLLPNIAMLSDMQCRQIRDYVKAGGSVMASFETSLYDENMKPRADFGLADVFGVSKAGDVVGTNGNAYYARIEKPDAAAKHPLLEGFVDTNWIPGAQNRVPLKPVDNPLMTVVPGFVRYPPELAYPPVSNTTEPAVVLRENGTSRTAWLPGDVERSFWITGHGDILRILQNTIRWVTNDERVVRVEGEGLVELFCWETDPGYAVHLLNYTNPDAQHGWLQSSFRIGPQSVTLKLPSGVRVKSVQLLKAETPLQFAQDSGVLHFTIPHVDDYEVAAISLA
jgi:hypothetical protein